MAIHFFLVVGGLCTALLVPATGDSQDKSSGFDRQAFYRAMELDKTELINDELDKLKTELVFGKEAFQGALLMKKAGFPGEPRKKLALFKSGRKKLEKAIHQDTTNAEFRFLRLMIQDHAPKVLGYKNDLKKDSEYILKSYKMLPGPVQQAIANYSRYSNVLKIKGS